MWLMNLMVSLMFHISYYTQFTNAQILELRKAFGNGSSVKIKVSKTQLSNMVQLGGFIGLPSLPFFPGAQKTMLGALENIIKNTTEIPKSPADFLRLLLNAWFNTVGKKCNEGLSSIMSSGIIITNNETKDITKAIISLENVWLANNTSIFKMKK